MILMDMDSHAQIGSIVKMQRHVHIDVMQNGPISEVQVISEFAHDW